MRSEWNERPLGDFITLKRGYDLPKYAREDGGVPVISSSGTSGTHTEAKVKGPGVITGRYGTIGQVFHSELDFWPLNTTLYVKDFKGNDVKFVSYLLRTIDFDSCSDKGAVPGVNRNHLHQLLVSTPPLDTQRSIAHILGTLDDKIELNRRTNQTLESIARALFKSWFIDFDPVHAKAAGHPPPNLDPATAALFPNTFEDSELGKIPTGWEVRSLDQIADYLNGLALQKYPEDDGPSLPRLKIAQLRKGDTDGADQSNSKLPEKYIVHDGDIIFSWSGSLLVKIWTGGDAALNQHLFKVTSDDFPRWFYYLWTQHHLDDFQQTAASKATTMGHIKRHHLSDAKVVIPPTDQPQVLEHMSGVMEPLLAQFITNDLESRTLATLRDTLLPKLLSGELDVSQIEQATA